MVGPKKYLNYYIYFLNELDFRKPKNIHIDYVISYYFKS